MYTRRLPYEPFFIARILQDKIIISLINKIVVTYVVGDLALID